jgi:hypothetical protein
MSPVFASRAIKSPFFIGQFTLTTFLLLMDVTEQTSQEFPGGGTNSENLLFSPLFYTSITEKGEIVGLHRKTAGLLV